jgi:hypothetical protein
LYHSSGVWEVKVRNFGVGEAIFYRLVVGKCDLFSMLRDMTQFNLSGTPVMSHSGAYVLRLLVFQVVTVRRKFLDFFI